MPRLLKVGIVVTVVGYAAAWWSVGRSVDRACRFAF